MYRCSPSKTRTNTRFPTTQLFRCDEILAAIEAALKLPRALSGLRALVTSGPTHEPIDPVRYIANRSSGKQGHAIATALARHGAETTLVSGPSNLPDPSGLKTVHVEPAQEMLAACRAALPVAVAICAAAVADVRVAAAAPHQPKTEQGLHPSPAFETERSHPG